MKPNRRPGKAGLNNVKQTASRLELARQVGLPENLFKCVPPKLSERYAKRAAVEEPFELRRHTEPLRATLLAAYLHGRGEELTDHLVDLLVETIQKASGKLKKLYRMTKACVYMLNGMVRASLQRSYRFHYRRMLPELLNALEFRCTNTKHQPVLQALEIIRSNLNCKGRTYPKAVQVPLKGVVSADWLPPGGRK